MSAVSAPLGHGLQILAIKTVARPIASQHVQKRRQVPGPAAAVRVLHLPPGRLGRAAARFDLGEPLAIGGDLPVARLGVERVPVVQLLDRRQPALGMVVQRAVQPRGPGLGRAHAEEDRLRHQVDLAPGLGADTFSSPGRTYSAPSHGDMKSN